MYTVHFGLKDYPFAITPDPAYLYLSPHHQEALAHLLYGAGKDGGFMQLTGEVGTGKTMLVRTLVEQHARDVDIALCLNPCLTVQELVAMVCDELQVAYPPDGSLKDLYDALNAHLLETHAQGRRTVLIVDEAQSLSHEVLEQIRLLTNLETHREKLLRVILVGQPELQSLLEAPDLRQLAQRITARFHLMPLNGKETAAYIRHRLQVAGGQPDLFTRGALRVVYRLSSGVPRLINSICDRALLGTYSRGAQQVTRTLVSQAGREVLRGPTARKTGFKLRLALDLLVLASLAAVAANLYLPALPGSLKALTPSASIEQAPEAPDRQANAAAPSPAASAQLKASLFTARPAVDPMTRLLALWGAATPIPTGQSPCEYVQNHNLRCLSGRADWQELRRYNRPVLLQLKSPEGVTRPVLLKSLQNDAAIIEIEDKPLSVSLSQIQPWWTGEYLLLWRPQVSLAVIGPGSKGEPVLWLRQRLALVEGQDPGQQALSQVFDPALAEQVRNFQRANELSADGVVGQRTMALLNNLAPAPGTPVLNSAVATKVN